MATLRVSRLQVRYRLPASRRAERARLDRVLRGMLDESLGLALERAGLDAREEVCIRRVHVPARMRMGLGDTGLGTAWSVALADAIRDTVVRAGPDVVRYRSRAHALADVLVGVATGDLRRAWAWRQLGLWRGGDVASPPAAAEEAARALASEASSIVPALVVTARHGLLPRLVRSLAADAWIAIARAALQQIGAGDVAMRSIDGATAGARASGSRAVDPLWHAALFERVLRTSAIARAVVPGAEEGTPRALAILALLEIEPAVFREQRSRTPVSSPRKWGPSVVAEVDETHTNGNDAGPRRSRGRRVPEAGVADSAVAAVERALRSPERLYDFDADAEGADPAPPSTDESQLLVWPRVSGETRWGGLLFLLNAVSELGIPDEIVRSGPNGPGSLRWFLHELALALVATEAADPAALAFAGLGPDQRPPEATSSQAYPEAVSLAIADRIAVRVAERMNVTPPAAPRAAAALLRRVCRRRGTIVADPGWLEVRLALDEVSTDVRRAGLDLDPGWLPWLGVVVRFVYE